MELYRDSQGYANKLRQLEIAEGLGSPINTPNFLVQTFRQILGDGEFNLSPPRYLTSKEVRLPSPVTRLQKQPDLASYGMRLREGPSD